MTTAPSHLNKQNLYVACRNLKTCPLPHRTLTRAGRLILSGKLALIQETEDTEVLSLLVADEDREVVEAALTKLAQAEDMLVRFNVAADERTPRRVLDQLAEDEEWFVQTGLNLNSAYLGLSF